MEEGFDRESKVMDEDRKDRMMRRNRCGNKMERWEDEGEASYKDERGEGEEGLEER